MQKNKGGGKEIKPAYIGERTVHAVHKQID
jgi:hypothetical protein